MERIKILQEYQFIRNVKDRIYRNRFEIIIFTIYIIYISIFRIVISSDYVLFSEGEYDWEFYYKMSNDITLIFKREIVVPFCYRVFYPFMVYLLPFDPLFSFSLISYMSFILMGIMMYYTLRLHFSKTYSAGGLGFLCLFMISSTEFIFMPFYIGFMIDPLVYLFVICCFYAILTSKKSLYMIFLFLGVLTKESVVLTIPVFLLCNVYQEENTAQLRQILSSIYKNIKYVLPSICILLVLRLIVYPLPIQEHSLWYEYYMYDDYLSMGFFISVIQDHLEDPFEFILGCTVLSWSVTFLFSFFNSKKNWFNWLKVYGVFMCFVYLQILVSAHVPRALLIAFYPMIAISILGYKQIIDYITEKTKQGEIQFFKPLEKIQEQ